MEQKYILKVCKFRKWGSFVERREYDVFGSKFSLYIIFVNFLALVFYITGLFSLYDLSKIGKQKLLANVVK